MTPASRRAEVVRDTRETQIRVAVDLDGSGPLAAGAQGQVLFVNLPLTYLKGRTDALPMHGFLHYFSHQLLRLTQAA